jgi:hypothetical protein
MCRYSALSVLLCLSLCPYCFGCECIGSSRLCEQLKFDAVFVGRVIETTAVKHPMEKDSYTLGYSMRFAVDESLRGELGTEVLIETGNGGGDCGTPLAPGGKFLIFAYKEKDGRLWTGMCSGNQRLTNSPDDGTMLEQFRKLVKKGTGSIFGSVVLIKPVWQVQELSDRSAPKPAKGTILYAKTENFSASVQASEDGTFEFTDLPPGKYTVSPKIGKDLDFDHEYEDRYQADLSRGACANINFTLEPATRIRGHVIFPAGVTDRTIEVVAIPTDFRKISQFTGKWDFTDENGRFDLWPLPPGDYYVGVNINSSPKEDSPFPPTYYPGVTSRKAASIVHLDEGQLKNLELPLPEIAKPRTVHFIAIGLDGKPMKKIYIQREDLRHPGDAASYVNVDLDTKGAGSLTVYAGYSYHLHASDWRGYQNEWCAKPVMIAAGNEPISVRFVMDHKSDNCQIDEIDRPRK